MKPKKVANLGPQSSRKVSSELDKICTEERGVNPVVLRSVLELAIEIAREGREGRKIGTLFLIGDEQVMMANSRELILDPLICHPPEKKQIDDPNVRETVKELAKLDGAFLVSNEGVVVSAARYIKVNRDDIMLQLGLGSRHLAAVSITYETNSVAIVVSESSVVRVVDDGKIIAEIIPELWLI